jgi:hypothetical protein
VIQLAKRGSISVTILTPNRLISHLGRFGFGCGDIAAASLDAVPGPPAFVGRPEERGWISIFESKKCKKGRIGSNTRRGAHLDGTCWNRRSDLLPQRGRSRANRRSIPTVGPVFSERRSGPNHAQIAPRDRSGAVKSRLNSTGSSSVGE